MSFFAVFICAQKLGQAMGETHGGEGHRDVSVAAPPSPRGSRGLSMKFPRGQGLLGCVWQEVKERAEIPGG